MEITQLYQFFSPIIGITTDSRNIQTNQLYFALKGSSFNGNEFAQQALLAGASYAIIDEEEYKTSDRCIVVKNVLQTLQALAQYHLQQVKPKAIIAITGSNGKTTTKELVNAVLATTYQTHYTKGNLNNHIGIPLTILQMQFGTEIAIIEMGANHQKEIESYCSIVQPTHGIITNCGKAHLEGFGGLDGIRKGKGELYDFLNQYSGTVFVNGDDTILLEMIHDRNLQNVISYGKNESSTFSSVVLNEHPFLKIQFESTEINSHLYGNYNFSNIMCAIALGKYFKVENENIKQAIEQYNPTNSRSQLIQKATYSLILDAYNANPSSMQHALENFAHSTATNKIVILGDMFELGKYAAEEHQKITDLAIQLAFDTIVLVGEEFDKTTGKNLIKFKNSTDAGTWFREQSFKDAEILLKGSRGMKMEKVVEA